MTFPGKWIGLNRLVLLYKSALTGIVLGAFAASPTYAVECEKGMGDTEIQCIAKNSSKALYVSSVLEVPVTVFVTQWLGACGHSGTVLRADFRTIPAHGSVYFPVTGAGAGECRTLLFSECRYSELVDTPAGSVARPFACGELLDMKGH